MALMFAFLMASQRFFKVQHSSQDLCNFIIIVKFTEQLCTKTEKQERAVLSIFMNLWWIFSGLQTCMLLL